MYSIVYFLFFPLQLKKDYIKGSWTKVYLRIFHFKTETGNYKGLIINVVYRCKLCFFFISKYTIQIPFCEAVIFYCHYFLIFMYLRI
uniref:Uncharacterized protein n=1 Tax=Anguilla anguilla TaxID=7936 RepID=A0A0E9W801_ANGAN